MGYCEPSEAISHSYHCYKAGLGIEPNQGELDPAPEFAARGERQLRTGLATPSFAIPSMGDGADFPIKSMGLLPISQM